MIVRVFATDGQSREVEFEDVTEVIVYTDALVPLGRLDLRPPRHKAARCLPSST